MVSATRRLGTAVCILILLLPQGLSESSATDDAPQLIVNQNHGILVESILNITGTYIDEEPPIYLTWKIFNQFELIEEGDLLGSLTESGDSHGASRNSWSFSLDLNVTDYAPCSCLLKIEVEDTNNQHDTAKLILFSHGGSQETVLAPSIVLDNQPNQLTGTVELQATAMDGEGYVGAQWAMANSSDIAVLCMQSLFDSPESVQWSNMSPTNSNINQILTLDTTNFADGDYYILFRAVSDEGLYSACTCLPAGIDNNGPTAIIEGPIEANEVSGEIHFDGSGSDDPYWGREGLMFLWVLENEAGEKAIESGVDLRTFSVDASKSGNYTLTLTVVDQVGFLDTATHHFSIINQIPVAALRIGGQALEDGDQITLTDSSQWPVECGDSTDSDNDKSGLVCTWYIDDEPLMTGWSRQLESPADLSKSHTLTLVVSDDDGGSDSISVTFGVQGTPSDPMYTTDDSANQIWIILTVIGIIIVSIPLIIFITKRYTGKSTSIPKWKIE